MAEDWEVAFGRLEERMQTMQAEYKTDIALLAKEIADGRTEAAQRDSRLEKELASVRTEAAQRETNLVIRIAALLAGAVAILGLLIRVW